jgi:hypothetical protein
MEPKRTKKYQQLHGGVRLKPDSSWGKETLKFKVDKKNNHFEKERTRCSGEKCKAKEKIERNFAPKGEECQTCYNAYFEEFRVRPSQQTPYFDNTFLTRFSLT